MKISNNKIESIKSKLSELFGQNELCFGEVSNFIVNDIEFYVFVRYKYDFKAVYIIVPIKSDEQFHREQELKKIAKDICIEKKANFAYYSACQFFRDEIVYIANGVYEIFNPIQSK